MKTRFITSVVALVFASASLFAADPAATVLLLNQKGSTVYKLVYKAPGTGKAMLKISNQEGVVFSETVTYTNGFAYPIDFKGLTGEYTVEVVGKNTKFKQTVTLVNTKPTAYVRVTEQANKKELLTITSAVPADFTIRVFDKFNHEVLSKVETVKDGYAVLLNMNGLGSGYSIEVTEAAGNVQVIRK
jgi:hypothetical protein